jgi:hypothetical protein
LKEEAMTDETILPPSEADTYDPPEELAAPEVEATPEDESDEPEEPEEVEG